MSGGLVQMIEQDLQGMIDADDGLGDLADLADFGASEPPPALVWTMQALIEGPEVKRYLRALGKYFAKRAVGVLKNIIYEEKPTAPNPWIEKLFMPLAQEVIDGAADELKRVARPWAIGLAALTGVAGLGVGAIIAGRRRAMYERGRRAATAGR